MLELLYEMIYLMLMITLILDFAVARIMHYIGIGESKVLSPIIGTAVGWLIFWMAPKSMAGVICGIVITIVGNLILTHLVYPKLGDKVDKHVEKSTKTHNDNEFDKILFSADPEERVKYLYRHMQFKKFYCFSFSADSAIIFKNAKEVIENSDLLNIYPEAKMKVYEDTLENPQRYLSFSFGAVQIVFINTRKYEQYESFVLGIRKYDDSNLKLKERIALENKIGHFLDKLYMLVSSAIKNLDTEYKVEIIPFNLK